MANTEFDYSELTAFNQRVQDAGDTVTRISINEGLRKLGKVIVRPLANATPKVSGKLARSTVFQIIGGPKNQVLEIRQAAKSPEGVYYGYIVREGSGLWGPTGQPIRAINAKALHFFIGGQEFFRTSVMGQRPNPYHRRLLSRLMPQIQAVINEMGQKITAYISGTG